MNEYKRSNRSKHTHLRENPKGKTTKKERVSLKFREDYNSDCLMSCARVSGAE